MKNNELITIAVKLHENYNFLRTYKTNKTFYRIREVEYAYQRIIDVSLDFIKKWRLVISDEVIDCLSDIIKSCLYVWENILDSGLNHLDNIERNINKIAKMIKENDNEQKRITK